MPIYEYECRGCGKTFEVFQKHSDPPPVSHECGSSNLQRVMSRTSFVLKGSGWYVTDYARKEKKDGGDKSDKSEPKPDKAA
ncbi:MAG: zinc ribbon domain-containing protein [Deltaproteobacteria bacterium]|nr:zinc ribbon domain-containing protein [Deltaproteobacteria bacterium]